MNLDDNQISVFFTIIKSHIYKMLRYDPEMLYNWNEKARSEFRDNRGASASSYRDETNARLEQHPIYSSFNMVRRESDIIPQNARLDSGRPPPKAVTREMIRGLHGAEQIMVPGNNPALQRMILQKEPAVVARNLTASITEEKEPRNKLNEIINSRILNNHYLPLYSYPKVKDLRSNMYSTRFDE